MRGGCGYFAKEILSLSQISETDANVNLVGMDCAAVQSESVVATCIQEDVLAVPGENSDIEAASSSTTTYNAVANFQVGSSGGEINTGDLFKTVLITNLGFTITTCNCSK